MGVAPYALAALVITAILIGAAFLAYRVYKKKGGKRTASKLQFAAAFLLMAWLIVVLGLTTLSRGANYSGWINLRLFSGYVSAWNNWSLSEFQMIIFNMLMFIPLGFFLPLLGKRFRSASRVFLITLSVTAGIELLQMLTRMGIFELDDLLHNTIGSMAGYFLIAAILACVEKRRVMIKPVLVVLTIPLFFTALFSTAMIIYSARELGNLPMKPAIPQNMSGVTIQLETELSASAETAVIYRNSSVHNIEYGETIRDLLMERFGLEQKGWMRIDGSNRAFALTAADGMEYIYIVV